MSDAPELILYQEALRRVTAERDAANERAEAAEREKACRLTQDEAKFLIEKMDAARAEAARYRAALEEIRVWATGDLREIATRALAGEVKP